ncbi:MAG: hypothetical protein NT154_13700, partial [Verrucomicrobia bacterium]|nr:hypothetical protein [Verrucomicrobiota bacterium]
VRILTRSPLARLDFDLFKEYGDRLAFGLPGHRIPQRNPDYLHKPTDAQELAFPTPRNWANASRSLPIVPNAFGEFPQSSSLEIF